MAPIWGRDCPCDDVLDIHRLDQHIRTGSRRRIENTPSKQFLLAVVVLFLLTGCLAQRQREAVQAGTSCLLAAYSSPNAAPLRVHEPFNVNEATLAQLADNSFATEAEIASVSAVHPRLRGCQNEFLGQLEKLAPAFAPIFAESDRDADDDTVALIQRKMTWGDYTKRRRDRAIAGQEAIIAEERKLAAEDQARAAAMIQGLAAAYAITQAAQPAPPPRATFTTCTQQGAFLNCVQQQP